ncbi:MAG: ThuA domain-containing protein, partial [Acidobacteria bacterium]|nr:ThuA domain-containing protein [Acidobacteriota bacterium]
MLRRYLALSLFACLSSLAAGPSIRVMLLDGQSGGAYHAWRLVTPVLKKQLEETGM